MGIGGDLSTAESPIHPGAEKIRMGTHRQHPLADNAGNTTHPSGTTLVAAGYPTTFEVVRTA